jgi:6-phosphogluconolactonase (cycloisomerase 2 family)
MKNIENKLCSLSFLLAFMIYGCTDPATQSDVSDLTSSATATSTQQPTVASPVSTKTVNPPTHFIYTVASADHILTAFGIDPDTGALSWVSQADGKNVAVLTTGSNPKGVVIHPNGNFIYVINTSTFDQSISQYSIQSNGGLVVLSNKPGVGFQPTSISFGTDGKIYIPLNDGANDADVCLSNSTTGQVSSCSLTNTTTASANGATLIQPMQVTYGSWTYKINTSTNVIEQYDNANMSVVLQTFTAGNGLSAIALR